MRASIHYCIRSSAQRYTHYLSKQNIQIRNIRTQPQISPCPRPNLPPRVTTQSSYSSYILLLVIACGSAVAYDYFVRAPAFVELEAAPAVETEKLPCVQDERHPAYSEMPIPEGCLGNLTEQQEAKLREFWGLTLKTFGVSGAERPTTAGTDTQPHETPDKKKKSRVRLFSRARNDEDGTASSADDDDKYGQTAELQHILRTQSADSLRVTFWDMVKADHPDALLLRFLRARKWDVNKALAMLVSTMHWRSRQMHVDDDIMRHGESGALADSNSSDAAVKREGHDFLAQMRLGKSFLHGADREGRPITYVRVRLHRGGEQTEKSMERYTVYVIETGRLTLTSPVETACIVFDMTSFTLANMDYAPVKFMIKAFEANYPESLGAVIVHKAPWVFQGIWKIIRGWLDPVVAAKVHFTNSIEDLDGFIPKDQIIKELGGTDDWEYKYVESVEGENSMMKDTDTATRLREERMRDVHEYQDLTIKWVAAVDSKDESSKLKTERDSLANKLNNNYWQLDPYIRARSLYDRVGLIEKGGKINFYPQHTLKAENVNGVAGSESRPQNTDVHPDDDVD